MFMKTIHHVGIAVNSIEDSILFYTNFLGMKQITSIVEDDIQKVKVVLLASKNQSPHSHIELIEELESPSPITNLLKQKNRLYHICIEVLSIQEAITEARQSKAIVILKPTTAKLFNGRKIAFIYTPDRYIIEFLEAKSSDQS